MTNMKSFHVIYDKDSDVLYINTSNSPAARGVESTDGVLWRYAGNGDLIGVTVFDFHDFWYDRRSELAGEMARRFDVPPAATERVLDHALD